MPVMMDDIEEQFAAAGVTPKGRNARRAIFAATYKLMTSKGIEAASLEAIAHEAGMTQAAVRHYFPTREELLTAFFVAATQWFQDRVTNMLTSKELPAREQLERCITWHLEYMESVDTSVWLDASAYWLRHRLPQHTRDEFYQWVLGQYARLIRKIRPALDATECKGRAYALLTLVLGAWITHGRGSAVRGAGNALQQRRLLLDTAMTIVNR